MHKLACLKFNNWWKLLTSLSFNSKILQKKFLFFFPSSNEHTLLEQIHLVSLSSYSKYELKLSQNKMLFNIAK